MFLAQNLTQLFISSSVTGANRVCSASGDPSTPIINAEMGVKNISIKSPTGANFNAQISGLCKTKPSIANSSVSKSTADTITIKNNSQI